MQTTENTKFNSIDKMNYVIMDAIINPEKLRKPMKKVGLIAFVCAIGLTLSGTKPNQVKMSSNAENIAYTLVSMKNQSVKYLAPKNKELEEWLQVEEK